MNKIKRFLKTSVTYFIGSILSKLISFFLLPLYTVMLSPEEFGSYDVMVTTLSFFAPIAFFQIWDGMFRYTFDKQNYSEKYSIISNSFSVLVIGLVIYSFLFGVLYNILNFEIAWLVFFYGVFIALQNQYAYIARSFLENKLFVFSGLMNSLLSAFINIVLIVIFDIGIESLYISFIVGAIAQLVLIEIKLQALRKFRISNLNLKVQIEMIKFSLPLCIASVSYWMLSGYTKIVISQQLGTYANGLYAVAAKFTSMITIVISVFQFAWNEMAYLMVDDENRIAKFERSFEFIFKGITISSGIFMLLIKLVFPYLINNNYHEALIIIPLSLIGVGANAFASFVASIFMTEKKTKWIFGTTIIAAAINLISLWIFTPIWGLQGAVGALCISFISLSIIRLYVIGKIFNIKLSWKSLIYIIELGIVSFIFFAVNNTIILILIILLLCTFAAYSFRDILLSLFKMIKIKKNIR